MRVPTINIAPFFTGEAALKRAVAGRVARACEDVGFLVIEGHGVPQAMVDRAFATAAAFYDQPDGVKERYRPETSAAARGYHRLESKNLAKTLGYDNPPDLREQFYLGPLVDRSPDFAHLAGAAPLYGPNIWPETPAAYRPVFTAYYQTLEALGAKLMRVFAVALDVDERYFDDKIDRHFSTLPANNYPALDYDPLPDQVRCGEHTDFGSLTILAVSGDVSGLQIKLHDGSWQDVTAQPGQFIINIGDMMQRWTNDRWLSNVHRVINPPRLGRPASRRMSIGYFLHPNYDAEISALPSCVDASHPIRHSSVLAGELMRRKIEARAA
ncbi:MAG: isopenicillin N synthase family oxygenase [Alphaproteobacteria bacterium]|nr:isopenicillin N synthase family oxygenase [Alphaproteobacteria bacterium]